MTGARSSGLERRFELAARNTSVATEVRAGVVTFLTMSYILFVNAQILSQAGLPAEGVVFATAIASAVATLAMGLTTNYPFALAPGMGLNAYFAYSVVGTMGVPWPTALAAVFAAGILFMALSLGGARRMVLEAIPEGLKVATAAGIGLFLAMIGLQSSGLVVDHPVTLVTLGSAGDPGMLLAMGTLIAMTAMLALRITGALLYGILGATGIAWATGLTPGPARLVGLPGVGSEAVFALDFAGLASTAIVPVILAFLFVDLFDTAGTLVGVGRLGGFLDANGNLPKADRAFFADALGTTVGATLGTSPVTTYIESATGIEEGGRTGLTAVTVAGLFLAALFFTPLFVAVPALATAPALVLVGALMMRAVADVPWRQVDEAVPAFLTMAGMAFTFSIANGICLGVLSHTLIRILSGRWREVHPVMAALTTVMAAFYALI